MDIFITNEHNSAQEDSSSLGISHQDSGLTDEDLFDSHRYGSDASKNGEDDANSQEDTGTTPELPPTTPPTTKQKHRPDTTDRGPLSPFSPLARSQQPLNLQQESTTSISWQSQQDHELSLLPCRKVSVVVKVHVSDNNEKQCIFPLVSSSSARDGEVAISDESPTCTRDLVVVNPSAFGTKIPAQFTMDTARLVANVASIESEDWARRYRFDQILWPSRNADGESSPIVKLAASMGNDAVQRGMGSVCIGIGGAIASSKRQTVFGDCSAKRNENHHGMLGMVAANVLSQLSEHTVCTLSILEIVDEDEMRDLLVVRGRTSSVTIRHVDQRGAAVHGLSDMPLDSMTGLNHLMKRAFPSSHQPRESRGHIICSLKVWQNGVQLDLKNTAKCTTLTLVDLASGEEGDGTNELRMACFRKSVSGLRGVLRSLLQQQHDGLAPNATSYRECTLTQVLQRPLVECQAVVLGNVDASADCYERTLHTLNYINRLLIRPGKTARSPFTPQKQKSKGKATESPSLLDQYGHEEALLQSVVSDPRQRLAKVMSRRPFTSTPVKLNLEEDSGEEGYEPIDYMEFDPGEVNKREVQASPMRPKLEDVARRHEFSVDDLSHGGEHGGKDTPSADEVEVENQSNDETDDAFSSDNDRVSESFSKQQLLSGIDTVKFKTIGSPSEESSTQPVDSMSTSVRTGLRLTQSPDDVNEWVASFEANAEECPDSVHANARPSEHTNKAFVEQSADSLTKDSSNSFNARGSDWEDVQHEDADSDESQRVEYPPPNGSGVNEMATSFEGMNAPGNGKHQQLDSGKGTRNSSRLEVETPFADRRKVFSTPIAVWPEIDDDQSAMSLSSLHKDVGNDVQRPYLSEPSPRVVEKVEKVNPVQSHSLTPPVPRSIETPSSRKHVEVNQSATKSPADDFIGEIHVLEDAVDQIKRVHNGLWETSAASLERLRQSQELQKRITDDAVTARRESEAETERLEQLLARETEECKRLSREYDERVEVMESRIQKSLADSNDLEKIAEEAIAAQDGLEQELMQTQEEVDRYREAAERATLDYSDEVESNKNLAKQLELALKSLNEIRSAHSDCKDIITDLGMTIEQLRIENDELKQERDVSQSLSVDQSRIIAEQARLKQQFDRCQEEMVMLQDENEKLTSNIHDYQDRFKKAGEQQKTLRIQFESENLALQNDIDEWQRRYLEVEDAKERELQEFREAREVVMNELSYVKKQLEESRAEVATLGGTGDDLAIQRDKEIDLLSSEMRELQLERERDRTLLSNTERNYDRLKNDAKEKLKQLVKEKKAAASTIETLQQENAAHGEASRHLRYRVEQAERERELLQSRLNDVLDRLEVETAARQEAEDRIQSLESSRARTSCTPLDIEEDMSSYSSLHLEHYSGAEQALLREIEAEKSNTGRRSGLSLAGVTTSPNVQTLDIDEVQEQRELLAQFQIDLDARYGSEQQSDNGMVPRDAYRAEQNRRSHAEELVAAIGVRAKESIEKRNKEIMNLKVELALIADEKEAEILRLRSQLHSLKRESMS